MSESVTGPKARETGFELSDADVAALRRLLPATGVGAYLNTGTAGPLPTPVVEAMAAELATQGLEPRSGPEHHSRYLELAATARSRVASMVRCSPEEVALTGSTTEGMALVTLGIAWEPGDEAVTTSLEHPGALFPLYVVRDRWGVVLRQAAIDGCDDDETVDAIASELGPRTKLVSLSHVSFQTGARLPIERIAEVVHAHGAILLVDGAQSFGALDLDVTALGADAYAASGQKWLCGPEGTGALYCRSDLLPELQVTLASFATAAHYGPEGYVPHHDGRRLEFGTTNPLGFVGQASAVDFLSKRVGLAAAARRALGLAGWSIEALDRIGGVTVLTPRHRHGTLVTFTVDGVDATSVVDRLAADRIFVRSIREIGAVRLSVGYFTTTDELEQTVASVAAIALGRR